MLAPWKKSNGLPRQHIRKQRHYFAHKGPSSQSYCFSISHVWMIKKADCWRIDAFELWCWRRLLRVPWTARKSNQSILKEISPNIHWRDWCWSWNSYTLATWCKELTHRKRSWCWWRFKVGGKEGDRGWDGWMASQTQWTWVWVNSGSWWCTGRPGVLQSKGLQRVGHDWVTELNWTIVYNVEGNGNPLHYSCLENPMDREAWPQWWDKSWIWLNNSIICIVICSFIYYSYM